MKAAIVTGASRGIGRAVAVELGGRGFYVAVNYRSGAKAAEETLRLVREAGGDGETIPFDVADREAVEAALEPLLARLETVDVLVNNAGVIADGLMAMMPPEDWSRVVDTSLNGFYNVTRPVLMKMIGAKKGSVVSIASVSALLPHRGQANYSAAKAGLIGASRSLAAEVARLGVRVNVVAPGLIETDMSQDFPKGFIKQMVPMARVGRPEEAAKAVWFLCSDDASYITGQVLSVNGGMI
jgi:3-oxoacyl-[acyl-carrier protein] reductase